MSNTDAPTQTIYQAANLSTDGQTLAGDPHPSAGLNRVLLAARQDELSVNAFDAAHAAVQRIADAGDRQALEGALESLLALRLLADQDTEPQVAMRNVRAGDVLRLLDGSLCHVLEVSDNAPSRSFQRGIHLKVAYHNPDGRQTSFSYPADVSVPLLARQNVEPISTPATPVIAPGMTATYVGPARDFLPPTGCMVTVSDRIEASNEPLWVVKVEGDDYEYSVYERELQAVKA